VPNKEIENKINQIINQALDEDLGELGDLTSNFTIPENKNINFKISNREAIILCGTNLIEQIFSNVAKRLKLPKVNLKINHQDGEFLETNTSIIQGSGNARVILAAERLALNLMQHLSGIATVTRQYVEQIPSSSKTQILDTRKTLPALRILQKYAVKIGGATNHRMALFDGILIKDNHIAAAGSIENAVKMVRENLLKQNLQMPIEVECDNLDQVLQATQCQANIIMLDNMSLQQIQSAVKIINSAAGNKAKIEVSGGITLGRIKEISTQNVDFISIGALTHSVKAVDIGLDFS
jgi:nicotinate-nucleotide pyrophosphorylase (carboxylating)